MIQYPSGNRETQAERLLRVLPLLACPKCKGVLVETGGQLSCQGCDAHYPIKGGVPVLLPTGVLDGGAMGLSSEDRVSRHPYGIRAEEIIRTNSSGWVLDLGAGGKLDRRENVVQLDIFRYPAVDVVGTADCLPFKDNSFDAVISQAVFEHLQYPEWAVREVRRVLKPGGSAKIDTAFLQPEHGYPFHFYNATETGLLHWFRDFEIEWSGVEPFQHPKWALHWLLDVYLDYIGEDAAVVLRSVAVGELLDALQRHSVQQNCPEDAALIFALDAIPEHLLRVLAAGVSVVAINPNKHITQTTLEVDLHRTTLDREREMAQLRFEKCVVTEKLRAAQDNLKSTQDKAEYLAQFYPSACNLAQFAAAWADPMHLRPHAGGAYTGSAGDILQPFATIVVRVDAISPLLDTFFSLVNQTYGGWELLLLVRDDVSSSARLAANVLARLDRRVLIVDAQSSGDQQMPLIEPRHLHGKYRLDLPEGAEMPSNALQEVLTAARYRPGILKIGFDFDRTAPGRMDSMRCHTLAADGAGLAGVDTSTFSPCFALLGPLGERAVAEGNRLSVAHIPKSLVHLTPFHRDGLESERAGALYLLEQYQEVAAELQQMNVESPTAARELRQLKADVANYLAQFYFDTNRVLRRPLQEVGPLRWLRQAIGRWLRYRVPFWMLGAFRNTKAESKSTGKDVVPDRAESPVVSLLLKPDNALSLIETFFSLVHQSYSGWELVLVQTDDQSPAVRRAIRDFSGLDKRIVVVYADHSTDDCIGKAREVVKGKFCTWLVDGVSLAFNALEQVVTLVSAAPGVQRVICDFDCIMQTDRLPIRCHNLSVVSGGGVCRAPIQFDATFVRNDSLENSAKQLSLSSAHIPLCLFHQTKLDV